MFGTRSADLHCLGHVRQTCTVSNQEFLKNETPYHLSCPSLDQVHQCIDLDGRYLSGVVIIRVTSV